MILNRIFDDDSMEYQSSLNSIEYKLLLFYSDS